MNTPIDFDTWQDAFDHCRDVDRPVLACVGKEIGTVYPSGYFRPSKAAQS